MAGAGIWAAPLNLSDFNILVALLGGWISLFGLVSFLLKEHFYMSEALISLLVGVAFGPHAANLIRPGNYAECNVNGVSKEMCHANGDYITLNFSRLVLGIQLVIAGVQLPSKYLKNEFKPLMMLLGPGMASMWLASSLLVWGLAQPPSFLHALVVGSCVTPTDPVLSAVIVKGKFADRNIPKDLQNLVIAESGANDGLGYPFLFFALYLIKFSGAGAPHSDPGDAMGAWFTFTWAYTILMSIVYGGLVGYVAKILLRWAEDHNYVDRESFLVFVVSLALFVLGTCGLLGTDDILACFIAGNAFTWDDWFRIETQDDSLQPTMDMLLNVTIFMWYGAAIPWSLFRNNSVIPIYKLIPLGILVLLVRRLPWIFAMRRLIHQIKQRRQAVFVGFFGPVGVSAVFYLFITLEFIEEHLTDSNGRVREDVSQLGETVRVVVWFIAVCSIVVHGLSIPLGRMGYLAPRTLSRVISENVSQERTTSLDVVRRLPGVRSIRLSKAASSPTLQNSRQLMSGELPRVRVGGVELQYAPKELPVRPHLGQGRLSATNVSTSALGGGSGSSNHSDGPRGFLTPTERGIRFPDELPREARETLTPRTVDGTDTASGQPRGTWTPSGKTIKFPEEMPRQGAAAMEASVQIPEKANSSPGVSGQA